MLCLLSFLRRFIPGLVLLPVLANACQCEFSLSSCKEAAASNFVFIGTVELVEPKFLNGWNAASPAWLRLLNDAYIEAEKSPSPKTLASLKSTYLRTFPELDDSRKQELQAAKTLPDVAGLFYSALDRGMRVRFKVKTLFKHGEDDDDADDQPDEEESSLEVYTPFGDCGYDFQTGETYLVYANRDEDSNYIFTGSCTRTRRLSDAGEDLAYLFFYKDQREESARVEGFATTDGLNQLNFDHLHGAIRSPVAGATIGLKSDKMERFTRADQSGRFVFDGLSEGDYKLSALVGGSPLNMQVLAGPQPIHVEEKSCVEQILLMPKAAPAVEKH